MLILFPKPTPPEANTMKEYKRHYNNTDIISPVFLLMLLHSRVGRFADAPLLLSPSI
jgi:hypothetical protein